MSDRKNKQEKEKNAYTLKDGLLDFMNLIFEEAPVKQEKYLKQNKRETRLLAIIAAVFVALGIVCLCLGEYAAFLIPLFCVLLVIPHLILCLLQKKQYLIVYEDKIVYKGTYQKKERELPLSPDGYTVEVRDAMPKYGYTVKLIFKDNDGKKLFTYKAVCTSRNKAQGFSREIAGYRKQSSLGG